LALSGGQRSLVATASITARAVTTILPTSSLALARELADLYPGFAQKLIGLLERVVINDGEIDYINDHALPKGADRLLVTELKARGLSGWFVNNVEAPRITSQLCLPPWQPRSNYLCHRENSSCRYATRL
jgi:hypothetical protein